MSYKKMTIDSVNLAGKRIVMRLVIITEEF